LLELLEPAPVDDTLLVPVDAAVPLGLLEGVPVADTLLVPVDAAVLLELLEGVLVALDEPVPVELLELEPVELDELVPVALELDDAVLGGDCVLVPVTDGTSTVGSETVSAAARSTGLTPVEALYASKKPDVDSESSSGDDPPSCSLDCTLLSAVTRLDAVSCCAPVTSLMLEPAVVMAGMTMRSETPLSSACSLRAPACILRPLLRSAMASWNQMARPGPSSASDVTHRILCMG
jgi:hypothetical protein